MNTSATTINRANARNRQADLGRGPAERDFAARPLSFGSTEHAIVEEAAGAMAFLAGPAAGAITGQTMVVDGGLTSA